MITLSLSYGMMQTESVTSPAKPFAEPPQDMVHVHGVVLPGEPRVQAKMSEASPLAPLTAKGPIVVSSILPAVSTQTPFTSSPAVVDRP